MMGLFDPDVAKFLNVVRLLTLGLGLFFDVSAEADEFPDTIGHTRPRESFTDKKSVLLVPVG